MKTKIAEVKNTFDNDNYIEQNEDGTYTIYTTLPSTYRTEEEAVAAWVELWNEWHEDYCISSKYDKIHADLTNKAQQALDYTDQLEVLERMHDCEYVYDLRGCISMHNLTEDDLNEVLEILGIE